MKPIKGYKAMDKDMKCRNFQYEVGKTYIHEGEAKLCNSGFHFCKIANDVFEYYSFDIKTRVFEIEAEDVKEEGNKCSCTKITILREIDRQELLTIINIGKDNTGRRNTGDSNTGDSNTGNRNTGDWNTGNWNTGDRNTGNWNTGYRNTGYSNTGNWNTTNYSSGFLNTIESPVILFNKPTKIKREDINFPNYFYFDIVTTKYLDCGVENIITPYKEAFINSFNNASKFDVELTLKLPNFNYKVFEEISGISKKMIINKLNNN